MTVKQYETRRIASAEADSLLKPTFRNKNMDAIEDITAKGVSTWTTTAVIILEYCRL